MSRSSRTAKTDAPITGPSSVPRPPKATITRTRTSTRSKTVRRRADEARAVGEQSARSGRSSPTRRWPRRSGSARRSHPRARPPPRRRGARGTPSRSARAGAARKTIRKRDEQSREEVVGADAIVGEIGGSRRHDETSLASRQVALAEEEVREREREHERDDAGEDDAERAPHRDPAQEPSDDRRAQPCPRPRPPPWEARSRRRGWRPRSHRSRPGRRRTGRAGSCSRRSG